MATPIYYIKQGNLSFANKTILSAIEFYLYPEDKICLIGKNGCGKSTLMKVISGEYELDNGEIFKTPGQQISYLKQDIQSNIPLNIYDFILCHPNNKPDKHHIDIILEKLKLDGNLNLTSCSGGQIRRAYLAKSLVMEPDILLLDEPTNHLDIATIEWLEEFVQSYKKTIICISHDRAFLSNVTNKIWWLDRGELRKSDKGFKFFNEWQDVLLKQEETALRKLNKKLECEDEWLHGGLSARRKRNQKRLEDLIKLRQTLQQHSTRLHTRQQKIQIPQLEESKETKFIIEAVNISFAYNNKDVIRNFSLQVQKGEKIGIIGPNGVGKSTFLKLLSKQLAPSQGKIRHGAELTISYLEQNKTPINSSSTIQQILCPSGGDHVFLPKRPLHVAAYLKKFMFDPKIVDARVSTLSGGELSRLLLAKMLIQPGNLLILDEPTNDLDMDSLEVLIEILADFTGTLIIVSHDRDFLDRLVTRSLIFVADNIIDIVGGYQDYQNLLTKIPEKINKKIEKITPVALPISNSSNKLSYKYQRLLESLPQEIEQLEAKIQDLETQLSSSDLYLKNPQAFINHTKQLENYKTQRDNLLEEWIKIEEMQTQLSATQN